MPEAKEMVSQYVEQESAEVEETLATLVEFLVESGMSDDAVSALCDWIDQESLGDELAAFLQQKGVSVEEL